MSRQVEANIRLVKLHLQWPDRRQHLGSEQEAIEFFEYLFLNFHMDRDVMVLESVDDVLDLLKKNSRLLTAKPAVKKTKSSNARIEPRITNDAHVVVSVMSNSMISVNECADAELVAVTPSGRVLDVGLHGLRIVIDQEVPKDSQVALTVTTDAGDRYELEAVVKWSRAIDDGQLIGFRILETAGFVAWQADFGAKFVGPRLARHNQPSTWIARS